MQWPLLMNLPILEPNLQNVVGLSRSFFLVAPRHEDPQLVLQVLVALTPIADLMQELVEGQHLALWSPEPETADQASSQRSFLFSVQIAEEMHFPSLDPGAMMQSSSSVHFSSALAAVHAAHLLLSQSPSTHALLHSHLNSHPADT